MATQAKPAVPPVPITQAPDMSKKPAKPVSVTTAEVHAAVPKTQTIQLRLSDLEKDAVKAAASACGRSVSEYLLELVKISNAACLAIWQTGTMETDLGLAHR